MDRSCMLPALGEVDEEAGEFWVANPFMMLEQGKNLSAYERNKLYLNLQGRSFLDVSFTSGVDLEADSRSIIAADFDGDDAVDLLVGSSGGGPLRLFRNQLPQQNRVRIEFVGVRSNRFALGTRVVAHCGQRKTVRDVFAVNGFMGQAPPELVLGLGQADRIDRLEVRWPTGATQTFRDVAAGSHIRVREGAKSIQLLARQPATSP